MGSVTLINKNAPKNTYCFAIKLIAQVVRILAFGFPWP